jgi:phosphatidylinositol glycan class B
MLASARTAILEAALHLPWRRFLFGTLALSLALSLVVAHRSAGFYQCDEHYQVLEFLGAKLGTTRLAALPWEYAARMRSWLLPALFLPVAELAALFGLGDPFSTARVLRCFAALLSFGGLAALSWRLPLWLGDGVTRRLTLLALHFFYWVPLFSARTSSENLTQAFFLLGLSALLGARRGAGVAAGFLFGLAFLARYQSAFLIAGACLWFWLDARSRLALALAARLAAGFAAALALGAVLDRWGYGEWALPYWNYLRVNLLEHVANRYGTSPVWGYFTFFATELVPPLGLIWLITPLVALLRLPRHLLTWTLAPFVLVHLALAHKETRFLFPTLALSTVLLGVLIERELTPTTAPSWFARAWPKLRVPAAALVLAANVLGFCLFTFEPPRPQWSLLEALDAAAPRGFTLYAAHGFAPMYTCGNLHPSFYEGTRRFRPYVHGQPLSATDARGLPAFYGWSDTPARLPDNPFAKQCTALATEPWTARPAAQALLRLPLLARFAPRVTAHVAYRCGN